MNFDGVYAPIITPFDEQGGIDREALASFTEVLIANGVDGIVADLEALDAALQSR